MDLHDSDMHSISGRKPRVSERDFLGTIRGRKVNRKNIINHVQNCIERGLDDIPPLNRSVSMQDLLQDFSIRYESLTFVHEFFQ